MINSFSYTPSLLFSSQSIWHTQNTPCELLEFSPHGVLPYFSFSRISYAVMPDASSFFSTASASTFLTASAAFASAAAFLASSFAIFFSVCLISAFCGFRLSLRDFISVFSSSIWATVLERPSSSVALSFYNFAICASRSVNAVTRFLLPLVLGIRW